MLPYKRMSHFKVTEIQSSTILTPQKVGSLAGIYEFSLNPYAGCAFSCSYCYVPKFPGKHEPTEWGRWVEVKLNAPELIQKERMKVFGSRIFFSSATDPYQYLELKYRLSRRCLEQLLVYKPAQITMHTRSHLILQDVDLLKQFGKSLKVGVSITTDNEIVRSKFEPKAPSIRRRIELIRELHRNGIEVYASLSPLLPCNPERLVALISPYLSKAWIDEMRSLEVNNRPELLKEFASFFEPENYRRTIKTVQRLLGQANRAKIENAASVDDPFNDGREYESKTKSWAERKSEYERARKFKSPESQEQVLQLSLGI